jgi:Fe-S-cluster containining protein
MAKLPPLAQNSVDVAAAGRTRTANHFKEKLRLRVAKERRQITCTKYCDHCCYYPLQVSVLEGIRIYQRLVANHQWTKELRGRLQEHQRLVWDLDFSVWALARIPCPLLRNHECQAYENRPLSCRATFSTGDPHHCHAHRLGTLTEVVDRTEVVDLQRYIEAPLLSRHRLGFFMLPLSVALIVAHQIVSQESDLEDLGALMRRFERS